MRAVHGARDKLASLPVGGRFVYPRASLTVAMYVSHYGTQHKKKFKTRRVELGREITRKA